jgi:hypothetical protein
MIMSIWPSQTIAWSAFEMKRFDLSKPNSTLLLLNSGGFRAN